MKAILKLALGLLAFALIVVVCRSARADAVPPSDNFIVEAPGVVTGADYVEIYPFDRPVRVVAGRNLFADGFE